jgi:multiple antibiotic resistance protein
MPSGSSLTGRVGAPSTPATPKELEAGRRYGALIAQDLVQDIQAMGMPAIQAGPGASPQVGDCIIRGYIVSTEGGGAGAMAKRLVIGFGAGTAEMDTVVEGFVVTPQGWRRLGSGTLSASGNKTPGLIVPAAVTIATGNPVGLIVVGGAKLYGAASGRSGLEGRAKATADEIAAQLRIRFQDRGWISQDWNLNSLTMINDLPSSGIAASGVDLSEAFMFFFLMLGPFKILGPFTKMTKDLDDASRKGLATRAIIFSGLALALATLIGEKSLANYRVSLDVLAVAGGLVLFLVSIKTILAQFDSPVIEETVPQPFSPSWAVSPLAFPTIVTPYGIAAVIIFATVAPDFSTKVQVVLLAMGVLVLDLVAMLFGRPLLKWFGMPLALLGVILAIIQLAIGLQVIFRALNRMGVMNLQS